MESGVSGQSDGQRIRLVTNLSAADNVELKVDHH